MNVYQTLYKKQPKIKRQMISYGCELVQHKIDGCTISNVTNRSMQHA